MMSWNVRGNFQLSGDGTDDRYADDAHRRVKGKGIKELLREVIEVYEGRSETVRHIHINYGKEIEDSIVTIRAELKDEKFDL